MFAEKTQECVRVMKNRGETERIQLLCTNILKGDTAMQQTLTMWEKYRKIFEKHKKSKKGMIVISLFLVFFVLAIIVFLNQSNSNIWIKEKSVYLVCCGENLDLKSAEIKQKEIVSGGGAGTIIGQGSGNLSCVIFAYNNLNDAEKIKSLNNQKFDNLYIKCLKLNNIDRKMQDKIKNKYDQERVFYLYSLLDTVPSCLFEYEKSILKKTDFLKKILEINKQIKEFQEVGENNSVFSSEISSAYLLLQSQLEKFFEEFSEKKETLSLKKFYIDLIFEVENINKKLTIE